MVQVGAIGIGVPEDAEVCGGFVLVLIRAAYGVFEPAEEGVDGGGGDGG